MIKMDLVGQKFNKLTVLEKTNQRTNGKIVWKCQCDCGNIHYVHTSNLKNGSVKSCGKCFQYMTLKVQYPKRSISHSEDIVGKTFGCQKVLQDSGQKKNTYKLYLCECINCKTQSLKTISQLKQLKGAYCFNCHNIDITNKTFGFLTAVEEVQKADRTHGIKSKWRCLCKCGQETIVSKPNLTSGNTISCGCAHRSKGELKIEQFLKEKEILFETEKTFNTCIFPNTKQKAKFDFYLPSYNMLIEYDGQQHFKDVEIFIDSLEQVQYRDSFKEQWCQENNIKLLRIPFSEYNNIENILISIFK